MTYNSYYNLSYHVKSLNSCESLSASLAYRKNKKAQLEREVKEANLFINKLKSRVNTNNLSST